MLLSTPGARDTRHEHPAHTAASQARPALETQATNENSCGVEWPAGWPPGCRRHRGQTPPPQPARPRSQRPAPDALPRGRLAGVPHLPARGAPPLRAPGRVSGAPPGSGPTPRGPQAGAPAGGTGLSSPLEPSAPASLHLALQVRHRKPLRLLRQSSTGRAWPRARCAWGPPRGRRGQGDSRWDLPARPELTGWQRVRAPCAPPPSRSVELTRERSSPVTASLEEAGAVLRATGAWTGPRGEAARWRGPCRGRASSPRPASRADHSRDRRPRRWEPRPGHQALAGPLASGPVRPAGDGLPLAAGPAGAAGLREPGRRTAACSPPLLWLDAGPSPGEGARCLRMDAWVSACAP